MKRKLLTLVFIVSGLMPAIAQNVSDLKTEKDMDRIELCKKNYTTLFGGEALTGQGSDPEMMDILQKFIFGDIFLHDVRKYREQQLSPHGIEIVEPLWGKSSEEVMNDFLVSGFRTVVVTTMADGLGADAIGREIDRGFIASLPAGVDPNGENGEYHTFCYDGPIFRQPVPFRLGRSFSQSYDIRLDDGTVKTYSYWFADLQALNTNSDAGTGPASE